MPTKRLDIDDAALAAFCRRHHVIRLSLFGSVLAGQEGPTSDIDLLVEFELGQVPGMVGLAGMESELSALLRGRRVDLRTPNDLSRYFREDVIRRAEVQFAR